MTESEILDGIRHVARVHLRVRQPIDRDTDLVQVLQLDSLRMLTLVAELENRFAVSLQEGDERGLVRVGDLVAVVQRRLAEARARVAP